MPTTHLPTQTLDGSPNPASQVAVALCFLNAVFQTSHVSTDWIELLSQPQDVHLIFTHSRVPKCRSIQPLHSHHEWYLLSPLSWLKFKRSLKCNLPSLAHFGLKDSTTARKKWGIASHFHLKLDPVFKSQRGTKRDKLWIHQHTKNLYEYEYYSTTKQPT